MLSLTALLRPSPACGEDMAELGLGQRTPDIRSISHESHTDSFLIWSKPSHC